MGGWRVSFLSGWPAVARGDGEAGSQAYLGPRALVAPGDMMIDRVSPRLRGEAAAQSFQAVRVPCAAGRVAG